MPLFGGPPIADEQIDAPKVEAMAREMGPITEGQAVAYAQTLGNDGATAKSGCYVVHCMRPCKVPVGCGYMCNCGD